EAISIAAVAAAIPARRATAPILPITITAAAAVSTTAATVFTRTRFVDCQGSLVQQIAVKPLDGFLTAFFRRHFDKAEPLWAARLSIRDQVNLANFTGLREQFPYLLFSGFIGQVANVQFLTHV